MLVSYRNVFAWRVRWSTSCDWIAIFFLQKYFGYILVLFFRINFVFREDSKRNNQMILFVLRRIIRWVLFLFLFFRVYILYFIFYFLELVSSFGRIRNGMIRWFCLCCGVSSGEFFLFFFFSSIICL
jgi:hypothetical protein